MMRNSFWFMPLLHYRDIEYKRELRDETMWDRNPIHHAF